MAYEVYLYAIPKVSEDGLKSLPIPESKKQEFGAIDEAQQFAAGQKDKFDRVVVMESGEGGQKLVARYMDGQQA
jgi:hypothetical protein